MDGKLKPELLHAESSSVSQLPRAVNKQRTAGGAKPRWSPSTTMCVPLRGWGASKEPVQHPQTLRTLVLGNKWCGGLGGAEEGDQ